MSDTQARRYLGDVPEGYDAHIRGSLSRIHKGKPVRRVRPGLAIAICVLLVACTAAGATLVSQLVANWTQAYQDDPNWYPRGRVASFAPHAQPVDGDIAHEKALEIALDAVMTQYGVDFETLNEEYKATTGFFDFTQPGIAETWETDFPGYLRYWAVYIQPVDLQTQVLDPYAVFIDAQTGEVLGEIEVGSKG